MRRESFDNQSEDNKKSDPISELDNELRKVKKQKKAHKDRIKKNLNL